MSTIIICEPRPRWAAVLRRELKDRAAKWIECRTLADCDRLLVKHPAGLVCLAVDESNIATQLAWLARADRRYPRAIAAALVESKSAAVADSLREAGAAYVAQWPHAGDLPKMIARHMAETRDDQDSIESRLPWNDEIAKPT